MSGWLTLSEPTLVFRFSFPRSTVILLSCHRQVEHVVVCRDGDPGDDGSLPGGKPPGGEDQRFLAPLVVQWGGGEG